MHRIPLSLLTPSIEWDRNLPEGVLFERTLNKSNAEDMNTFITLLDSEAAFYKNQSYKIVEDLFSHAQNYLKEKTTVAFSEGLFYINFLILRAPKDSIVLTSSLRIRGYIHYHDYCFERAYKDYEMYLEIYKIRQTPYEEVCEVYGHMVVCMYMTGKLEKIKKYFRLYKKFKAKVLIHGLQHPTYDQIDKCIKEFDHEIDDLHDFTPTCSEDISNSIPHKGFKTTSKTAAASTICVYKNNGMYAKNDVDKASVLFMEDPIYQSLNVPFLDCELCYKQSTQQIYTCLECRYKTYCSLSCLEKDKAAHKYECVGYEQLTLIILDASNIFRVFVRISIQLNEKLFIRGIFRKLKKADEVWNQLLELLNNRKPNDDIGDMVLIKTKPNYDFLSEMQYATVVATACRLTLYIERKTDIIDKFYKKLQISNKQKMILIGSILMRLHCKILLNSFDFEITRTVQTYSTNDSMIQHLSMSEIDEMLVNINKRHGSVKDIDEFFNIDVEREIQQRSEDILNANQNISISVVNTHIRHVKSCKRVNRILSTYKDNIAALCFQSQITHNSIYGEQASEPASTASLKILCGRIADMSDKQRYMFVQKFARLFHINYIEYFLQVFRRTFEIEQVLTLYCPILHKFNHRCDPNVEVIVLGNGNIIGKSLREIKSGEQLYISYKANYMHHHKLDRQMFLNIYNLNCECKYCNMNEYEDPTNLRFAIYCELCKGVEITPNDNVCSFCNSNFGILFNKYRRNISLLENEIKMQSSTMKWTERDIYILHIILVSHSKMYFSPQNELRISLELKMAYFLAVQNFSKQSFNMIIEVRNNILKYYNEEIIWFTFYAEILQIIKVILFNNLENELISLLSTDLYDLCSLGLYIAFGQKNCVEFYEVFDEKSSNVLDDIKILLEWKETIVCSEFLASSH